MSIMNKEESAHFTGYKMITPKTVDEYGDSYFVVEKEDSSKVAVRVKKDGTRTERKIQEPPKCTFKINT